MTKSWFQSHKVVKFCFRSTTASQKPFINTPYNHYKSSPCSRKLSKVRLHINSKIKFVVTKLIIRNSSSPKDLMNPHFNKIRAIIEYIANITEQTHINLYLNG